MMSPGVRLKSSWALGHCSTWQSPPSHITQTVNPKSLVELLKKAQTVNPKHEATPDHGASEISQVSRVAAAEGTG